MLVKTISNTFLQDYDMGPKQSKTITGNWQIGNQDIDAVFNKLKTTAGGKIHDTPIPDVEVVMLLKRCTVVVHYLEYWADPSTCSQENRRGAFTSAVHPFLKLPSIFSRAVERQYYTSGM